MQEFSTIAPIFVLISLGWFARHRGFIPPEFLAPANRLTYYFAIPAMVFRAISQASIINEFHSGVILTTLFAASIAYGAAWLYCKLCKVSNNRAGGLIQSAAHGNLGDSGLVKAGIISGFLMILQNVLSVSALQAFSADKKTRIRHKKRVFETTHQPDHPRLDYALTSARTLRSSPI